MHCQLQMDFKNFPLDAFVRKIGARGAYYEIEYSVGLVLGPGGIEFRAMYKGNVVGSVECDYF
jgi:hypothetical protein